MRLRLQGEWRGMLSMREGGEVKERGIFIYKSLFRPPRSAQTNSESKIKNRLASNMRANWRANARDYGVNSINIDLIFESIMDCDFFLWI